MPRQNEITGENAGREIIATRIFNTPRDFVFRAWTNPALLAEWWGPKGFTNTFYEFDVRPGGSWRFIMHGPNGGNYPNKSIFLEIVKPELIVIKHVSNPPFQITATFEELGEDTRLSLKMLFDTVAECNKLKTLAVEANEQNFDRLEALLAKMKSCK